MWSLVSTCVAIIRLSTSAKSNSRVARCAIVAVVTNDTDSCFGTANTTTNSIEPFLVTVVLQGSLRTNQRLPGVTTQWGVAVFPISDQWMQRSRGPFDYNKLELVVNPHTEADLGEGCVPVGGKFGLLWVKPSLPSVKVKGFFVAPERGIVFKSLLWEKQVLGRQINWTINYWCVQRYIRDAPSLYSYESRVKNFFLYLVTEWFFLGSLANLQFLFVFLYCIIFWLVNKNELNAELERLACFILAMWASAWVPAYVDFVAHFPWNRRFFRRARNRRILSIFLRGNATSKLSPINGDLRVRFRRKHPYRGSDVPTI